VNITYLSTKTGSGRGLTLTDEAIRKIIGDTTSTWIDFSDKDTWFKDPELTIFAIYPEDVRYVKNKSGPGHVKVDFLQVNEQGRYYIECDYDDYQQ